MAKHHKRVHNGKDRRTGRKYLPRPKKVKGRVIGKPRSEVTVPQPRPKCCSTSEQKQQVNERMFAELVTLRWDREWNGVTGTWKSVMPRHFVAKYRKHMNHFRAYARERMGL